MAIMFGLFLRNCPEILLSLPSITTLKSFLSASSSEMLKIPPILLIKSTPFITFYLIAGSQSTITVPKQMGVTRLNSYLPCTPTRLKKARMSEQESKGDLLWTGRSKRPGLLLRIFASYFISGYLQQFMYLSGFAPENYCCFSSTQQSPQNISEQQRITQYSSFSLIFPFYSSHLKYSLDSLVSSLRINLLNPRIANISP